MVKELLILGGAGFIGSNLAERFLGQGWGVTVLDGLLENTGGRRENIEHLFSEIIFIESKIEKADLLKEVVKRSDVIIDCMALTGHRFALADPKYDLELNCHSHLCLIEVLKDLPVKKVIYVGSRGQYGNPSVAEINEETPMIPEDVQGIHKLAAESYFRVYSKHYGFHVTSLRVPGCFGKNQPTSGDDIGLIGNFIRDVLENNTIEVYGSRRRRSFIYAKDLVEIVYRICNLPFSGFSAFNVRGTDVFIHELAQIIIEIAGKGDYIIKEIRHEIQIIDIGKSRLCEENLRHFIGDYPITDLKSSLTETIQYFKESIL